MFTGLRFILRSGGLLILRRDAARLAGQRLVAVHVGDCEPMLLKRFLKKRDAQVVHELEELKKRIELRSVEVLQAVDQSANASGLKASVKKASTREAFLADQDAD